MGDGLRRWIAQRDGQGHLQPPLHPHTRSKVTRTARVWRAQKPTTIHAPRMKHAGGGTGSALLLQLKPLLEFQRRFKEQNGRRAEDVEHPEHLAHLLQLYRRHRAELLPAGNLTGKEKSSRLIMSTGPCAHAAMCMHSNTLQSKACMQVPPRCTAR